MDTASIFRQLTTGISFDKKKYRSDAQIFGLTNKPLGISPGVSKSKNISLDHPSENIENDNSSPNLSDDDSDKNDEDEFKLLGNEIKVSKKTNNRKEKKKKSKAQLFRLHQEKINQFRNVHRIHVSGSDIPDPIDSWEKLSGGKLGLSNTLLEKITAKDCKYTYPTPIQMQAIPLLLGKI